MEGGGHRVLLDCRYLFCLDLDIDAWVGVEMMLEILRPPLVPIDSSS